MVFSSQIFLFLFLPVVLIGCFALRKLEYKNVWLLLVSIAFYAYGARKVVLILFFSVFVNWLIAILITKTDNKRKKKALLVIDVIANLSYLFYFKYFNFFRENMNAILGKPDDFVRIALPIGISFFTFQALSYCIDVYRDHSLLQKNILDVALYITFFPQLIAGPIVRYTTIAREIEDRSVTIDDFGEGVTRFVYGLGKKIILANTLAIMVDNIYAMDLETLSVGTAWLASIGYSFQIYFDFSGYSDMAIGLGRMFGFHFLENFNFPYISKTVSEFWRRWHISLSSWFKDYVYIPLGGNRKGLRRQILNLAVVWLCTGIWHGANWTFILWGVIYGAFIIAEKLFKLEKKMPSAIGHIYTLFIVNALWVLFRADNIGMASSMLKSMFGLAGNAIWDSTASFYLLENYTILILAALVSTPIIKKLKENTNLEKLAIKLRPIALLIILLICVSCMVKSSYNPFIYFNF